MKIPVNYSGGQGEAGGRADDPPAAKAGPAGSEPKKSEPEREGGGEDWKAMYVRLLADFDNFRKHTRNERERLAEVGKEAVLGDIIPVVEHLERAQQVAADAGDRVMIEGLRMVLSELVAVLKRHGVERVPTVGQPFDPALHEAVAVIPREGAAENTVVEEVRPGFIRDGKLLRPAAVVVAQ